jgi:hypothetical protein
MSYIVRYLKPLEKRFYKKCNAEKFIKKQYKTIELLEKKGKVYYRLPITKDKEE